MWYLAQGSTNLTYPSTQPASSSLNASVIVLVIAVVIIMIAAYWKIFTKAGQAGWKAIIPIYNIVINLRIVGMSGWYAVLFVIPFVNLIMSVVLYYKTAKAFGYGIGMTILEFFG